MTIGAALILLAVGAILRFALATVATHGVYLHTIGDILMAVGVLGLILWIVVWGPAARGRRNSVRQPPPDVNRPGDTYPPGQRPYEDRSIHRSYEDQYPP